MSIDFGKRDHLAAAKELPQLRLVGRAADLCDHGSWYEWDLACL